MSERQKREIRPHLVVVGFDEIVSNKYLPCIAEAIKLGHIDGYSLIDLEVEQESIIRRLKAVEPKPERTYFIPSPKNGAGADPTDFEEIFVKLREQKSILKVYIATELRAHEAYLGYCVREGIDSLTEKPVFAPFTDGVFDPEKIGSIMHRLIDQNRAKPAKHSIMTLGRYHRIYNHTVIDPLRKMVVKEQAPLTSFHLRAAGGVWNMHKEYESRDDHPYKYGYGMLMHGAYHYIDLAVQFLCLNKLIYPDHKLAIEVSSYGAYPHDQNDRISKKYSEQFDDNDPQRRLLDSRVGRYGETDITSTFRLYDKQTGRTITLGTLSFEQTTPSIRSWKEFPDYQYNKNGRTSSVDLEAQLATLFSVSVRCYDVPKGISKHVDRIDAFARVLTRANASLLEGEEYTEENTYEGLFHSDSNRALMQAWLTDKEQKSRLADHLPVMLLVEALSTSLKRPGYPVSFDME